MMMVNLFDSLVTNVRDRFAFEKQVWIAMRFLRRVKAQPRKTLPRFYATAYGLKHVAERWERHYISQDAFVAAMRRLGLRCEHRKGVWWAYVSIPKRWLVNAPSL